MKKALVAIEASTRQTSVAAWGADGLLFFERYLAERRHTGPMAPTLAACLQALDDTGVECSGVAIGTGPGSYNGLRAACALGQGLGLARGWPVGGWSSFLGLGPGIQVVAADARSGEWVVACVREGAFVESPRLCPAVAGAALTATWAAEGRGVLTWLGERPPAEEWRGMYPSAEHLARVAWSWLVSSPTAGEAAWPAALPMYLKPPSITAAKPATGKTGPSPAGLGNPAR